MNNIFSNLFNANRSSLGNWVQSWKNPGSINERKQGDLPKAMVVGLFRALSYATIIVPILEAAAFVWLKPNPSKKTEEVARQHFKRQQVAGSNRTSSSQNSVATSSPAPVALPAATPQKPTPPATPTGQASTSKGGAPSLAPQFSHPEHARKVLEAANSSAGEAVRLPLAYSHGLAEQLTELAGKKLIYAWHNSPGNGMYIKVRETDADIEKTEGGKWITAPAAPATPIAPLKRSPTSPVDEKQIHRIILEQGVQGVKGIPFAKIKEVASEIESFLKDANGTAQIIPLASSPCIAAALFYLTLTDKIGGSVERRSGIFDAVIEVPETEKFDDSRVFGTRIIHTKARLLRLDKVIQDANLPSPEELSGFGKDNAEKVLDMIKGYYQGCDLPPVVREIHTLSSGENTPNLLNELVKRRIIYGWYKNAFATVYIKVKEADAESPGIQGVKWNTASMPPTPILQPTQTSISKGQFKTSPNKGDALQKINLPSPDQFSNRDGATRVLDVVRFYHANSEKMSKEVHCLPYGQGTEKLLAEFVKQKVICSWYINIFPRQVFIKVQETDDTPAALKNVQWRTTA